MIFPQARFSRISRPTCLNIERDEIDLLENYCLAFGITANDWKSDKPWKYAAEKAEQFDEERVNRIRKKAIAPLRGIEKDNLMTPPAIKGQLGRNSSQK